MQAIPSARFSSKRFGPPLPSMQHACNQHLVALQLVGGNVGSSWDDEFACFRYSSSSTGQREAFQATNRVLDSLRYFARCCGAVPGYVVTDRFQTGDRRWRPANVHFGAGDSFSVPQLSSHSITRSFEMPWPDSNSARPARMCRCSQLSGSTNRAMTSAATSETGCWRASARAARRASTAGSSWTRIDDCAIAFLSNHYALISLGPRPLTIGPWSSILDPDIKSSPCPTDRAGVSGLGRACLHRRRRVT
jgi:hypothetical protein